MSRRTVRAMPLPVVRAWHEALAAADPEALLATTSEDVVVLQRATWPGAPDPVEVATAFTVRERRIRRIARHDTLAAALADAGLGEHDEARPGR